jgi:hypothetical protein
MKPQEAVEIVAQAWRQEKLAIMLGHDYFIDAYVTFL